MSSAQPSHYFLLGYVPSVVGIYFNSLELLLTTERGASPALQARIDEQAHSLAQPERRSGVIANVQRAAALLTTIGVTPPTPPQTAAEFRSWTKQVFAHVTSTAPPESPALAAHRLGFLLGELCLDLNLGVLVNYLLDVGATSAHLQEQDQVRRQNLISEHQQILRALTHPALGGEIRSAVEPALAVLAPLGKHSAGEQGLVRANALQQALRRIADIVQAIELLFGCVGSRTLGRDGAGQPTRSSGSSRNIPLWQLVAALSEKITGGVFPR